MWKSSRASSANSSAEWAGKLFLRRFVCYAGRIMASLMPAVVGRRRVLLRGAALFAFVAALVQLLRAFLSRRRLTAVRERHSFSPAEDGDGEPALVCAMTSPPATSLSPPPQTPPDSLQPKHDQSDSSADVVSLLAAEVAALREQLAAAEVERAAAVVGGARAVSVLVFDPARRRWFVLVEDWTRA